VKKHISMLGAKKKGGRPLKEKSRVQNRRRSANCPISVLGDPQRKKEKGCVGRMKTITEKGLNGNNSRKEKTLGKRDKKKKIEKNGGAGKGHPRKKVGKRKGKDNWEKPTTPKKPFKAKSLLPGLFGGHRNGGPGGSENLWF